MGRAKRLFLIGLLVMALPHLGFIGMIENAIYFAFGFIILVSAYGLYLEKKKAVEPKVVIQKPATTRTRAPKKIPSPYLPPLVKETAPLESNGFVFIKKKDTAVHE